MLTIVAMQNIVSEEVAQRGEVLLLVWVKLRSARKEKVNMELSFYLRVEEIMD